MARSIWTGVITFGLASLPVGLYTATQDHTVHFHQLQRGSADRIRNRRVNERTGRDVPSENIVKGYELTEGEYIVVEPDELDQIAPGRSQTIDITDFVDLADIEPVYFDRTYYVAPRGKEYAQVYELLRAALEESEKAGIATFVKANQHRAVAGRVKTVSVKREGRKWFVVLSAEQDQPEPLPATGSAVGIDLGIANFLAGSGGEFVPNPRHGRRAAAKLEAAQQALSRFPRHKAKNRTANHQRAVDKVAALHGKVRRQRLDHAHKTALGLVRVHDFIAHEDLKIRNMVKAPAPKPDPAQPGSFLPNGAAAKAGLNRGIADAGWGVFLTILLAKAESAGREVIAVDPRNTSRECPECGHVAKENRPTQEKFHCVACGHAAHADTVAALNVLRAGLARREAQPA
ncbi:Ku domain protein [Actinobacteria bacterium OK006]|nr:Ku domain protein [Actinobacteria bacterium OK006]